MPEKPPLTGRVGKRSIIGTVAKEVAVLVMTVRGTVSGSKTRLWQIDLHQVPAWPKSASRVVLSYIWILKGDLSG